MLILLYFWLAIFPFFLILSHVLVRKGVTENSVYQIYLGIVFGCLVGWIFIILWYWVLINQKQLSLKK